MAHRSPHRTPTHLTAYAREMRHEPTPAEDCLWQQLRNRGLQGFKFRRQQPVGPFIADFLCYECRLIVELDGDWHIGREEYDACRTDWLTSEGYRVIRFANADVKQAMEQVLECILENCIPYSEGT